MDMSTLALPAILLGVLLIFGVVFMVVSKRQHAKASVNTDNKKKNGSSKQSQSKEANVQKEDVFKFLEFDKILDNMIVQNDGTKFTMAIKCKGINYDLMSDMEQIAVEEGFITFLNTLRHPIQLYVQAQNIDLKAAINTYKQNAKGLEEEYDAINKKYTDILDQFDAKESDIARIEEERAKVQNVYEYASDIINYVERLSLNKSLLQRNFYVLVSYYSSEITSASNFTKEELINICYNELLTRAQTIISGLMTCSVTGVILNSNELADLLYNAYNRDDKGLLSVKEAIQSGFYRLYSTSEDVFYKKQEKMLEQINEEAELRALESVKKAIEEGTYVSQAAEKLNVVDQISKTAAEIVKKEDLPQDVKDRAKEILVEEYVEDKNRILKEASEQRQEIIGETKNNKKQQEKNVSENVELKEDSIENTQVSKPETPIDDGLQLDDRMGFGELDTNEGSENNKQDSSSNSGNDEDDLII